MFDYCALLNAVHIFHIIPNILENQTFIFIFLGINFTFANIPEFEDFTILNHA